MTFSWIGFDPLDCKTMWATDLKKEAACSSEKFMSTHKSTRRYNPEVQHRYIHRRVKFESHNFYFFFPLI
jgi:hypothetical protein